MGRKNYHSYLHSFYHVMLRGNYRQPIFHDKQCHLKFCELLETATEKFSCKIHLYCLMTNHVHLVIEVKMIPLSKIVQSIASGYAKYISLKFNRRGHLFQGRFKSKLIHDENYLINLCYYIHHNPLSANMVTELDEYPWTSHRYYKGIEDVTWLTRDLVLDVLGKYLSHKNSHQAYIKFIHTDKLPFAQSDLVKFDENGSLLITDETCKKMNAASRDDFSLLSIDEIIRTVCLHMKVDEDKISSFSQGKKIVLTRAIIAYYAHYFGKYYLNHIALYFSQNPKSVSQTMHRVLRAGKYIAEVEQIKYKLQICVHDKLARLDVHSGNC